MIRVALVLGGTLCVALALAADWLFLGSHGGFGPGQRVLVGLGVVLILAAYLLRFLPRHERPAVTHQPLSRRRRIAFGVVAASLAIGATLALAELTLRVRHQAGFGADSAPRFFGKEYRSVYDRELGWRARPSDRWTVHYREGAGDPEAEFRTNAWGFRDEEFVPRADEERWLFLGDSFTAGSQVDQADRYTDQLASCVTARVVNLGMAGYSTVQQLLTYRRHGLEVSPSIVFVQFFGNDLYENLNSSPFKPSPWVEVLGNELAYRTELAPEGVWRDQLTDYKISGYLPADRDGLGALHLLAQTRVALRAAGEWLDANPIRGLGAQRVPRRSARLMYPPTAAAADVQYQALSMVLADLRDEVAADGAQLVLIYLPFQEEIVEAVAEEAAEASELTLADFDRDRPFREVEQIAARLQIPVVDTRPALRDSLEQGVDVHWKRDRHFTRAGHGAVVQSLLAWLEQRPEADRIADATTADCGMRSLR